MQSPFDLSSALLAAVRALAAGVITATLFGTVAVGLTTPDEQPGGELADAGGTLAVE